MHEATFENVKVLRGILFKEKDNARKLLLVKKYYQTIIYLININFLRYFNDTNLF